MRRFSDALAWLALAASVACTTNSLERARGPSGGAPTETGGTGAAGAGRGGTSAGGGSASGGGPVMPTLDGSPDARSTGPEVLVPLQGSNLGHVFVDERFLWYVQGETTYQVKKDGTGTPQALGPAQGGASNRFLDDARYIYWLNRDRIERVPKGGGAADEWIIGTGTSFAYGGFAFADGYVYLLDSIASGISRMPQGGGALESVAQGLNTEGDKGGGVRFTIVDRTLYASYLSGIWSVSIDTRAVTRVSPGAVVNASSVVSLADTLYFVDGRYDTGGTLYGFRSGTTPAPIQTESQSRNVGFILTDETRNKLYWIATVPGPFVEFDVRSKRATTLTTKQESTGLPAADDTYLYWARNSLASPAIMRLKKP